MLLKFCVSGCGKEPYLTDATCAMAEAIIQSTCVAFAEDVYKNWKEKPACSYTCKEYEGTLTEKYKLNVEIDNCDIHLSKVCYASNLSLT